MKVAIGNDHAGTELKLKVIEYLNEHKIEYIDCGCAEGEKRDYPVSAKLVCDEINAGRAERGILICGTGIGIGISANKIKGIRCATCSDTYSAKYTRLHNDANVISFGARVVGEGLALEIVDIFLNTKFEGGRHARRVNLITDLENNFGG